MITPLIIELDPTGNSGSKLDGLIERTPFKGHLLKEILDGVEKAGSMISRGNPMTGMSSPLEMGGFEGMAREIILDIAATRKRSKRKYIRGGDLFFTSEGLRWATPEMAADHCASRIARDQVMDVTCGQGGQVLSFSNTCKTVIGVDIDPINCLIAVLNCLSLDRSNVTIINGDCLDKKVIGLAEKGCAIFSDPARPPGAEERRMEEILPDPRKVKQAYSGIAGGMCFELPPYISLDKIGMDMEAEYVSIDGRVNRLNIYIGDLKGRERSAVILPQNASISGVPAPRVSGNEDELRIGSFIFEVDPSVVKAGIEMELSKALGNNGFFIYPDERRCLMASDRDLSSPFLKNTYRLKAADVDEKDLIRRLNELKAGSVTLRFEVDPREYWKKRKGIEDQLTGDRKYQLFRTKRYLVLESM